MLKHFFALVIVGVLSCGPALADSVNIAEATKGLTEQQLIDLAKKASEMKTQNGKPADLLPSAKQLQEYAELGPTIGRAIGGAAKEIGVAATEFVQTPVGMVAAGLLVWKIIGHDVSTLMAGITMLVIGIPLWFYMFRRMCILRKVTVTPVLPEKRHPWWPFGQFTKVVEYQEGSEAVHVWRAILLVVLILMIVLAVNLIA